MKTYRPRKKTCTQWRECDYCGKRGYSSRDAAKRALAKASNKIRLYRCPDSGLWHATSQLDSWEQAELEQ